MQKKNRTGKHLSEAGRGGGVEKKASGIPVEPCLDTLPNGKALFDLAEYHFGVGEYEEAIGFYLETLKYNLSPLRPRIYLMLAVNYLQLARLEENMIYRKIAQEHYRTALRIHPLSTAKKAEGIIPAGHKDHLLIVESIAKESIFAGKIIETLDKEPVRQNNNEEK